MIRSSAAGGGLFLLVALLWALYDPAASLLEVASLASPGADVAALERSLWRRGRGSIWALRQGLEAPQEVVRLRCARLLALLGDDEAERVLLDVLSRGVHNPRAVLAERLLLSVWDLRKGPDARTAAAVLRGAARGPAKRPAFEKELRGLLARYPAWTGGYLARARYTWRLGRISAATQDALSALVLTPDDFEAIILLGRCQMRLGYPDRARESFEQALRVNPRLQARLEGELKRACRQAAAEQERRLIERRLERPVL